MMLFGVMHVHDVMARVAASNAVALGGTFMGCVSGHALLSHTPFVNTVSAD